MSNELALVEAEDLSLVDNNSLNANQLKLILKKTPSQYVHKRPAKGGGEWEYVTGGYVKKILNLMFGWNWSFEILEQIILHGEVIVKGKLSCTSNGVTIVKMQFGNKDIIYRKLQQGETERQPLSIGNDMKAAATDALKKCAAELGIAADIYNKLDFREINVNTQEAITKDDLSELLDLKSDKLSVAELKDAKRIVNNNETNSFTKLHKKLLAL